MYLLRHRRLRHETWHCAMAPKELLLRSPGFLPPALAGSGASSSGGAGPGDPKPSALKRAAALRQKYRLHLKPRHLSPALVAQHPMNRGGMAINGSRADELLRQVFTHFDEEEANHGAVAVEEQPNSSAIRDYNKEKALGDPALADVPEQAVPFGSLGASHINQVLRNIIFKATSTLVPEAMDSTGRLSLEHVGIHDPAMGVACDQGLKWDVLSHVIEREEPDGLSCIVAALNDRGQAQMLMHEMEALKTLARACTREGQIAQGVGMGTVRETLRQQGYSALAESAGL